MSSQAKWNTIAISMVSTPLSLFRSPGARPRTHISPAQKIALNSACDTIPEAPRIRNTCSDEPNWSTPYSCVAPL